MPIFEIIATFGYDIARLVFNLISTEAMLPEIVKCPACGEQLQLDKNERVERKFTCPECRTTTHEPSNRSKKKGIKRKRDPDAS